jgi:predicted permease
MFTRLRNKLRYLIGGRSIDEDIQRELEFHRDMLVEDEKKLGRSHGTAVLNAQRRLGNTTTTTEYARDAWIVGWVDALARDVRYALRSFGRYPAFTSIALLTLALGIGANAAIFRLVDTVLLRALPVRHPEELVVLRANASYWFFEQFRDRNTVFSDVVGVRTLVSATLTSDNQPLGATKTELVTGNYFDFLGVTPVLGRRLMKTDDLVGAPPVAVIGYGLWKRAFGGLPSVLGRTIRVSDGVISGNTSGFEAEPPGASHPGEPVLTIVGVAPPQFFGETIGSMIDVWTPISMQPVLTPGRAWLTRRTASWVNIMGRLRPGMSIDNARAPTSDLWLQIRADSGTASPLSAEQRRSLYARLQERLLEPGAKGFGELRRQFSQPLLILMTVVTLVLLIACLNVANLLLARATARRQEIAMRLSLGASRGRLIRQLLTEGLLLAAGGGLLGLGLSIVGEQLLVRLVSEDANSIRFPLAPDWRILAFTAGVSIASGMVFALAPALRGTRSHLQDTLKDSSRGAAGSGGRGAKALVAVQIAISLVLLIACGLFVRTLINLERELVGYNRTNLILARMDPVTAGYRGDDLGRRVLELSHRFAALPRVKSVTFSENGLFSGIESGTQVNPDGFQPATDDDRDARFDQAGPGYFTGVGIPIVLGRDFSERDAAGAPRVTVINETMAKFYFPNQNPIGRHIRVEEPTKTSLEIVGVARDAQDHNLRDKPERRFYVSYLQPIDGITTVNFEIRADGPPGSLYESLRQETERFDPKLPIESLRPAQGLIDDSIVAERIVAELATLLGVLALLLAAIGLYGVMSYSVARRTGEIGIRIALGASQRSVAMMILREIVVLVVIGSAVGSAGALGLGHFVESLMFGLAPRDPVTLIAAIAVLLLVALVAGYLPARRAARIDPVVALRSE